MEHKSKGTDASSQYKKDLEIKIARVLHEIGIPVHIRGYFYISDAVMMAVNDMSVINGVTNKVYPKIAQKYNANPASVERAILRAIEGVWKCGDIEAVNSLFGCKIFNRKIRPSSKWFIASMAHRIWLEQTSSE